MYGLTSQRRNINTTLLNSINQEEGFKLCQAWNTAINILQTSDTDSFNNIRLGKFGDRQLKTHGQRLVNTQKTMLQVKQQGTETAVGELTAQVDSTLQQHSKTI
jgi:hypothetical protein